MTGEPDVVAVVVRRWWPQGGRALVLLAALLVFLGLGFHQARADSVTLDEGVDLASGLTALVHHDASMVPEHPVLPKVLAAAPALLADPVVPDGEARRTGDSFDQADAVIASTAAAGRLDDVVVLARLVPLLLTVAVALALHALAARSFGPDAGLLAGLLWLTTPVVLGLGHLATIDVPFTLATVLVVIGILRFAERPELRRGAELGALVGASLATRHTGLVLALVALFAVGWALRADRRRAAVAAGVVAVTALAVLWGCYRVVSPGGPTAAHRSRLAQVEAAASADSLPARLVAATPTPIEWRAGFSQLVLGADGKPSYLLGQAWVGNRWWYFPGSLLVKVPLPTIALLLLGPLALRSLPGGRRRLLLGLGVPAAALAAFTVLQPLALGVRLVLPVLALAMVAASSVVRAPARWRRGVVGAVVAVQVLALVSSAPHSIAWTTPPFQPAYRWASDSNVDWGQDLGRLDEWSEGRRPWVAVTRARGLDLPAGSRRLVGADPDEIRGWVAVGASDLTRSHRDELAWLRRWCPVGTLGGSILLYRFDEPPGPRPGPSRPAAPCTGARWSRPR